MADFHGRSCRIPGFDENNTQHKKILKNLTFALNSKSFIKKALINTTTVNISIISIAITIQYVTSL